MRSRPLRALVWLLAVICCLAGLRLSLELTYIHLQEAERYVLKKAPGAWGFLGLRQVESRGATATRPAVAEGEGADQSWFDSMCSATETASCEEVAKSEYAVVRFPTRWGEIRLPVSLLGMFYFTAVLIWLVLIGGCTPSRWWVHLILVAGAFAGLGVSVFFEYIMWATLEHWCPLCVITHLLSLLLLVFALLLWPRLPVDSRPPAAHGPGAPPVSRFAPPVAHWPPLRMLPLAVCLALAACWAEYLWLAPNQAGGEIVQLRAKLNSAERAQQYYKRHADFYEKRWQHALIAWQLSPQVQIDTANRPFRGPANARHTLVVYSDFQCPACKKFEDFVNQRLLPLSERQGGVVRFVFKHWPICTDCNPYAGYNLHPAACRGSLAAEAARIAGGDEAYWKMHDLLWSSQARWKNWKNNRDFNVLAREIGLDESAFERAMASPEALAQVKSDIEEGANLGKDLPKVKADDLEFVKVNSTPAVFVDNKRLYRPSTSESLWLMMFGVTSRTTATRPASPTRLSPPAPSTVVPPTPEAALEQ